MERLTPFWRSRADHRGRKLTMAAENDPSTLTPRRGGTTRPPPLPPLFPTRIRREPAGEVPSGSALGGYRPALDGVRAVAVLAVIAYHLGWLPGGFLGVDVFFVLSGYLITTLLLREIQRTGRISFANFWARRARRLLPAVLFLLGVCILQVWHDPAIATHGARRDDIISTLFYYANWHFIATDQSYFATYAGVSPLRHMWSLAIEEQFYFVWPLLIGVTVYLARRRSRIILAVVVALLIASVADMAREFSVTNPSRAYFGTDTRAHVLLAGAALAVLLNMPNSQTTTYRRVATRVWPVLALIVVASFALYRDQAPFFYHGGAALFAVVVALLLWSIEMAPSSALGRALSLRPVQWIGWLSYSLYLWHWPVIVWINRRSVGSSTVLRDLVEIAAMLVMAAVSFYIVERPVRFGRVPWLRSSKVRLAIVVPVMLALFAGIAVKATRTENLDRSSTPCVWGSPHIGVFRWCVHVSPTSLTAPVVVTVGDSTSGALDPGMSKVANLRRWRYVQASESGCSVLPLQMLNHADPSGIAQAQECASQIPRVLRAVAADYHPNVWLISDRFLLAPLRKPDGRVLAGNDARRIPVIENALLATLHELTRDGGQVVIVGMPPPGPPPECRTRTTGSSCGANHALTDPPTRLLNAIYRRAASSMRGRVAYISIDDVMCPVGGRCPAVIDGVLARYDGIHYTATFSRKLLPIIIRRAERAGISFDGKHSALRPSLANPHSAGG